MYIPFNFPVFAISLIYKPTPLDKEMQWDGQI